MCELLAAAPATLPAAPPFDPPAPRTRGSGEEGVAGGARGRQGQAGPASVTGRGRCACGGAMGTQSLFPACLWSEPRASSGGGRCGWRAGGGGRGASPAPSRSVGRPLLTPPLPSPRTQPAGSVVPTSWGSQAARTGGPAGHETTHSEDLRTEPPAHLTSPAPRKGGGLGDSGTHEPCGVPCWRGLPAALPGWAAGRDAHGRSALALGRFRARLVLRAFSSPEASWAGVGCRPLSQIQGAAEAQGSVPGRSSGSWQAEAQQRLTSPGGSYGTLV